MRTLLLLLFVSVILVSCSKTETAPVKSYKSYDELVTLFKDWREFVKPVMNEGVPDYSKQAMAKQHAELPEWQKRLNSFDTTGWAIPQQVDWYLIYAEMNGLDFEHRVVRPWERDPAFYTWFFGSPSDVPEREGPTINGAVDLQLLPSPVTDSLSAVMASTLRKAPALFQQAKTNLTGNARDLWVTGTRSIGESAEELSAYANQIRSQFPDLAAAAEEASKATAEFQSWLQVQASSKTGQSGVGKEEYSWNLKYVHLLPYTWEDERLLLERELHRSHSGLRLAEHRNRKLPKLEKANNTEAYNELITDGVNEFMEFMDKGEFLTIKDYQKPAHMEQVRPFVPNDGLRGFFDEVDYRDPMPMRAHFYHWIDKARERIEPTSSPIRQVPLLYNIFDSRAEGMATAMEELVMNAGLLENRPRATELVYIMLAQRAARGLAGLYQHSGEMDFKQATEYASKWVPWGLLPADGGTIQHEEQFYIQQPGYGSSYVVGKIQIDQLIAEYARQREGKFIWRSFMDDFEKRGIIPMSLLYWEMTGDKSMLEKALK
jgi:hypothetical protein